MPQKQIKHAGVDYASTAVAGDYDEHHQGFRDYEKDAAVVIERLGMNPQHEVIDLGCGTGKEHKTLFYHTIGI